MSIHKSLREGAKGEDLFISLLNGLEVDCEKMSGKFIDYDVNCIGTFFQFTVEVKNDLMASTTGNIAIEFYNSKQCKPSGIGATKAELWCHIIGNCNEVYIANTNTLKNFLKNNEPLKTITCGGDKNSAMYIYKTDDILKIFKRIDNIKDVKIRLSTILELLNENT